MNSSQAELNGVRLLIGAAAIMISACGGEAAPAADLADQVIELGADNVVVVQRGFIESGPMISGSLVAEREVVVRAEVGGPVISVSADEGERVVRGEVLARLDTTEIEVAFLSARSAFTSAQLSASVASRGEERAVALAAAGAISEREVEEARRANVAAQAQLADARSRLALAEKQRSATRVAAPFSGVVSVRHIVSGDLVQPGNPLFTIVDPASMRLEGTVPASQLDDVKIGTAVRFTVSGYGDRQFSGNVTRVSPSADPLTGQIQVIVSIPNASQSLVTGLFAEGRIASTAREALLVPADAVNSSGVLPNVLRVKGGRVERVDVTVGARDVATEMLAIDSGVAAGDTLLLGSARGIPPGSAVRMESRGDRPASPAPGSGITPPSQGGADTTRGNPGGASGGGS